LVIFAAAQIDFYLRKILEAFLVRTKMVEELFGDAFAPLSSLSGKSKIAFVLGLITKSEMDRIDAVRKVRNVFAHEMQGSFEHPKVKKLCGKKPIFDGRLCDRDAFLHLAMNVVPSLMYRRLEVRQLVERHSDEQRAKEA
jgi:mannitol operon repressor